MGSLKKINNLFIKDIFHGYCLKRQSLSPEPSFSGSEWNRSRTETQRMTENDIGTIVVGAAIAVHRELGPGLLETVYEVTLARELDERGLTVDRQVPIAIRIVESFGADLIVAGKVIVELKSVERVTAAHNKRLSRNSNNNRLVPVDNSLIFINFMSLLRAKRTDSLTNRFFLLSIWPV